MRTVQVAIFAIGVLSFLASVLFIGQDTGDTLWRAGVAALLVDLVCVRLYPTVRNT
jgi:preprotein translocase subunit SecF